MFYIKFFSDAISKLRKATFSFVMFVRPFSWNNLAHTESMFMIFYIWELSGKLVMEVQVSLKSDRNNGYITWRTIYIFLSHRAHFFLEWELFRTDLQRKPKHTFYAQYFFFSKIVLFKKKTWKTSVEPGRPQMTIWRMCIACWIPESTHTQNT